MIRTTFRTSIMLCITLLLLACQEPTPIIKASVDSITVEYSKSSVSIQVSIENSNGSQLTARSSSSWVNGFVIEQDTVSFFVDENNSGRERSTTVILEYPGAEPVSVSINQAWAAAVIVLTPHIGLWEYTGGNDSFSFEINNPREGASITVNCEDSWIEVTSCLDNRVNYTVAENNSGKAREGKIILKYGSFATAEFSVSQKWSDPIIVLTPAAANWGYSGGDGTFAFDIVNPLLNTDILIYSNYDWITVINSSNTSVSYTVLENNSGKARDGKIVLSYGSFAVAEFIVDQSWSESSIVLTPTNAEVGHEGGSIEFNYEIQNPRQGATLDANVDSDCDWIKEVSITDSSIVVHVNENASGKSRTCNLYLTYGTHAYSYIGIVQNGTPASELSLQESYLDIVVNSQHQLVATVLPEDSELEWSSSAPQVASVQQNGLVSALSKGEATITVQSKAGGSIASCLVVVTPPSGGTEDMGEDIWK